MLCQEDKEIGTYNTNTNNLPGMVTWQHIEENKDQGEKVSSEEGRRCCLRESIPKNVNFHEPQEQKGVGDRMDPGPAVCEGHIVRMVTRLCERERSNRSTFVVPEGCVVGACLEGLGKEKCSEVTK